MDKRIKIAKYAYENSLFYREFVGCDEEITAENFGRIKVISKDEIVESNYPLMSLKYVCTHEDDEKIVKQMTSGSTGKMIEIEWNIQEYYASMYQLWILRYKYYGIKPNDRLCFFYSEIQNLDSEQIEVKNMLGFSKANISDNRMIEIYEKICEYQPVWMLLQPSIAGMLINVIKKYKLNSLNSIRYIEFSGEMLDSALKNEVQKTFDCKVANQYGSYEFNSIAYECPEGNMHVMEDNVYLETDECNNIILTSLNNYRTPFVRYNIGDKGKILSPDIKCKCGNCNKILQLEKGRSHEFILTREGHKINSYIFMKAMMKVNEQLDDIVKQFQVVQTDIDCFDVRLYLYNQSENSRVIEIFEENIGEKALVDAEYRYIFEEEYIKEQDDEKLMFFKKEIKGENIL